MLPKTVSKKYALALFKIATDSQKVNPVRELRPLTALADGGFKPLSTHQKGLPPTSSMAFSNGVNEVKDNLTLINDRLTPAVTKLLSAPDIHKEDKKKIIHNLLDQKINKEVKNFLYVLIEKKRLAFFKDIYNAYVDLFKKYNNITEAEITSPVPLKESEKEKIKDVLEKTHKESFILNFKISKDILGGLIIKIGNEIIDGSLKNQLLKIQTLLLK